MWFVCSQSVSTFKDLLIKIKLRRVIMVKLLTLFNYDHTLSKKTLNHNMVIYIMGTTKLIQALQSNT